MVAVSVAAVLAATLVLLLPSCAQEPEGVRPVAPETTATTASAPWVMVSPTPVTIPTTSSILPGVTVDDVAGGKVNLASLVPAPQPILVWFWAPT